MVQLWINSPSNTFEIPHSIKMFISTQMQCQSKHPLQCVVWIAFATHSAQSAAMLFFHFFQVTSTDTKYCSPNKDSHKHIVYKQTSSYNTMEHSIWFSRCYRDSHFCFILITGNFSMFSITFVMYWRCLILYLYIFECICNILSSLGFCFDVG